MPSGLVVGGRILLALRGAGGWTFFRDLQPVPGLALKYGWTLLWLLECCAGAAWPNGLPRALPARFLRRSDGFSSRVLSVSAGFSTCRGRAQPGEPSLDAVTASCTKLLAFSRVLTARDSVFSLPAATRGRLWRYLAIGLCPDRSRGASRFAGLLGPCGICARK
jgi:hypothetical protein